MLLATILLLVPCPQAAGNAVKAVAETAPVVISEKAKDSNLEQPLPSAPEAKIPTDAEQAQDSADASDNLGEPTSSTPAAIRAVNPVQNHPYETARQSKIWYLLSATGSGTAAFDAWSTRRVINGGYGTESNPLLRPFVHSNGLYGIMQVSPLVMDYIGKRMMLSQHPWMRRVWWVPQTAGSAFSLGAGIHNTTLMP